MDLYDDDTAPAAQAAPPAPPPPPPPAHKQPKGLRHRAATIAVTAGLLGGGLVGGYMVANAATASPSATPAPSGSGSGGANPGQPPPGGGNFDPTKGGHTANGITETLLTGDTAAKVTAAAKAAVPGASIQRVETDAEGSKYEAHMVKSDGTMVTVKVDANFKVTSVENGPR